jgi:hypothetical protein
MSHTYPMLGAVKPHVKAAALEIGNKFDIDTIYGIGARTGVSEHPLGLALDFMVYDDTTTGDQIADYVKQDWQKLSVMYMIWKQRIDKGGGWETMEDRGSRTANHFDHVHVSFEREPGSGGEHVANTPGGDILGSIFVPGYNLANPPADVKYPWNNWFSGPNMVRVFGFIVGAALIALTVWRMINGG